MAVTRAAGFPVQNIASVASISVTWVTVGDLAIVSANLGGTTTQKITALSSSKATGWAEVEFGVDATDTQIFTTWIGTVTATGADTVNITWNSTPAAGNEIIADELTAGLGATTIWTVVAHGSAATTTGQYPQLTSGPAALQVYWGYFSAGVAGSLTGTAGFTYFQTPSGYDDDIALNGALAATTAYQPVTHGTTGSNGDSGVNATAFIVSATLPAVSPQPFVVAQAFRGQGGPPFLPTLTLGDQTVSTGAAFSAAGVAATLVLTAPTGGVAVTLPGVISTLVLAALVGSVNTSSNVSIPGVTATLVLAANPGTVSTTLPGSTASLVFTAPPGTVSTSLPGTTASLVLAAQPGGVAVSLPGGTATVVLTALVGSVNTSSNITIPGVTATLVLAAQPGAVAVTLPGTTSTLVLAALPGSVSTGANFTGNGVTATLVLAAQVGAVSVTITGAAGLVVLSARTGNINVTLPGPAAAVVFQALAGGLGGQPVTLTATDARTATLTPRNQAAALTAQTARTGGPS